MPAPLSPGSGRGTCAHRPDLDLGGGRSQGLVGTPSCHGMQKGARGGEGSEKVEEQGG